VFSMPCVCCALCSLCPGVSSGEEMYVILRGELVVTRQDSLLPGRMVELNRRYAGEHGDDKAI
jgi:hypothetical protein